MTHIFDPITIVVDNKEFRYEGHCIELEGVTHGRFATAALVASWLVNTDEGDKRGIGLLETKEERAELMRHYERETMREDGGLLMNEVEDLYWWLWHANVVKKEDGSSAGIELCAEMSNRQIILWETLIKEYMVSKVESWCSEIQEKMGTIEECESYVDWLMDQLYAYERIHALRKINWLNVDEVEEFKALNEIEADTIPLNAIKMHLPVHVTSEQLMERYFELRREEHAERMVCPSAEEWYETEKQPLATLEYWGKLSALQKKELEEYEKQWLRYLSKTLKLATGNQVPVIWTEKVDDKLEEKLIAYLKIQEGTHACARNLCAAVYAMQVKQWVKKNLGLAEFMRWANRHLAKKYSGESKRLTLQHWWECWDKQEELIEEHLRRLNTYEAGK